VGHQVAADDHGVDSPLLDRLEEIREIGLFLAALPGSLKERERQDHDQADDHPECQVLVDLIHARKHNMADCRTVFRTASLTGSMMREPARLDSHRRLVAGSCSSGRDYVAVIDSPLDILFVRRAHPSRSAGDIDNIEDATRPQTSDQYYEARNNSSRAS